MKRRDLLKSIGYVSAFFPFSSIADFTQELPPLSPTNGGRSILPQVLHVGDIILSTTNHLTSRIIRNQTDLPISHARIVYNCKNQANPEFVEAVGSGVRVISYHEMMNSDILSVALRSASFSTDRIKDLQEWLLSKLGSDYDFGGVVEEWLALKFRWLNKWRSVSLGDPKKFYCSELVAAAYRSLDIDLFAYKGEKPNPSQAPGRFVEMTWFNELDYLGHLKY